jgi:hypothetical protein
MALKIATKIIAAAAVFWSVAASGAPVAVSESDRQAAQTATNYGAHFFPTHEKMKAYPPSARTVGSLALLGRLTQNLGTPSPFKADLATSGGPFIQSATQYLVFVNCAAGDCWGTPGPAASLADLNASDFIHILDQYTGSTANGRYPVAPIAPFNVTTPAAPILYESDLTSSLHAAMVAGSLTGGYDKIFHILLPNGQATCFDAPDDSKCYSPGNTSTFVFCGYHGAIDFPDLGHVIYTVEPYQAVNECSNYFVSRSGHSVIQDATLRILAHDLFGAVTNPDISNGFVNAGGSEIGDICNGTQFSIPLTSSEYVVQLGYSNISHACASLP